jgi:predicted lactoylglutathione lyase
VLGYRIHRRTEQEVVFGPPNEWLFFLYAAQSEQPVVGARMHLALYAKNRESALAFHAAAIKRGAKSTREVAHRPEFGPDYFGGMFKDLDGHAIEVVTRVASDLMK